MQGWADALSAGQVRVIARTQARGLAPYRHWQQERDIAHMTPLATMGVLLS